MKKFNLKLPKEYLLLFLYFPGAIFFLQLISNLSFFKALIFVIIHPLFFIYNSLLLAMLAFVLLVFLKKKWIVFSIINIFVVALGLATQIKINYRGLGFTLTDLTVLKEAGGMADVLPLSLIIKSVIAAIVALSVLFAIVYFMKVPKISWQKQVNGCLLILLFGSVFYFVSPDIIVVKDHGINRNLLVTESGSLYFFLVSINNPIDLDKPTKEEVATYFAPYMESESESTPLSEDLKPDIIMIQSESFSDPTILGLDKFENDPIPFFHQLEKESRSFDLLVPALVGGTSNTEFETLTGISTAFFPKDLTVFSGYLNQNSISLGSILRNNGYYSQIIHPYGGAYYRRNVAYKLLGFNEMKDESDLQIKNDKKETFYYSDMNLTKEITTILDQDTSESNFIMAVTMQNHVAYSDIHNSLDYDVDYLPGFADPETNRAFNKYLNGLKATDLALEELVNYAKNREKPTIIIFFGDHLPGVISSLDFYTETGWVSNLTDSTNNTKMHQTPGIIWSNYKTQTSTKPFGEKEKIDAMFLSEIILDTAGYPLPNYQKVLKDLKDKEGVQYFNSEFLLQNNEYFDKTTPEYQSLYKRLQVLTGDILIGKRYLEQDDFTIPDNSKFIPPNSK